MYTLLIGVTILFIECDGGLFGVNCSTTCGHCLNNQQCHHLDGTCAKGCDPGYMGDNCAEGRNTFFYY